MSELPTGTVTFLFTDIEGSTRLLQRLGDRYPEVLDEHRSLLRAAFGAAGGREVGTEGDGFFVAFPSATAALAGTVAAQRALFDHDWPEDGAVRVRMGLHTGEANVVGADYVGIDVHRAARIAAAAHGGQVLLSETTRALVEGRLPAGVTVAELGEHRLKDLAAPERLSQLLIEGLPADFPPIRSLDARPNNLPAQLTAFVGRDAEVAAVKSLLAGTRLLTLTGPAGIGKTRLALQVAGEVLSEYADGVFFVALAPISDPALVPSAIAQAVGVQEAGERPMLELLQQHLADREVLLLLDNFEQVLDAATVVVQLLGAAPRLKALVTSRAVLRVTGEQELPVPPLAMPDPRHLPPLEALSQFDAVALFIQRARAVNPSFAVTNESAPAVAETCTRLDGLPLAIELAAARTKLFNPDALLRRLTSRLDLLQGGARELPERQKTLRGAIAWSYDLLEPDEQALFPRLGVFVGGCSLAAAEEVAGEGLGIDALDGLASLVDKSLLRQHETDDGEPRFHMLETIREYARERLLQSGEEADVARRHAALFLRLVEEGEPHLTEQGGAWLGRLELEHDNLRAALRSCVDAGDAETALRMAGVLWRFWHLRGHLSEGRAWLGEAVAHPAAAAPTAARAKALNGLAGLAYWQTDYQAAGEAYEESLAIYRELGDDPGTANALYSLSFIVGIAGDFDRAIEHASEAWGIYQSLGDRLGTAYAGMVVGLLSGLSGDWVAARRHIEESEREFRELGDTWGLGNCLHVMARIVREDGDLTGALEHYREALMIFRDGGNVSGEAMTLGGIAALLAVAGRHEEALRLAGAAAAAEEAIGGMAPVALRGFEDTRDLVRGLVPEEAMAAAWDEGLAIDLDKAVALALEADVTPPRPGSAP